MDMLTNEGDLDTSFGSALSNIRLSWHSRDVFVWFSSAENFTRRFSHQWFKISRVIYRRREFLGVEDFLGVGESKGGIRTGWTIGGDPGSNGGLYFMELNVYRYLCDYKMWTGSVRIGEKWLRGEKVWRKKKMERHGTLGLAVEWNVNGSIVNLGKGSIPPLKASLIASILRYRCVRVQPRIIARNTHEWFSLNLSDRVRASQQVIFHYYFFPSPVTSR